MNRKQASVKESEQEASKGEKKVNRKQARGKESEQEVSKGERK